MVGARARGLQLVQAIAELDVEIGLVEVAREIVQPFREIRPLGLVEIVRVAGLRDGVLHPLAELIVGHESSARAEDIECRIHASHACEIVEAGDQFAPREVARSAEDDKEAGVALLGRLEGDALDRVGFNDG